MRFFCNTKHGRVTIDITRGHINVHATLTLDQLRENGFAQRIAFAFDPPAKPLTNADIPDEEFALKAASHANRAANPISPPNMPCRPEDIEPDLSLRVYPLA
jgi:hypothetical protein